MKYVLIAYIPTAVIVKQSLRDGRSFVALPNSPNDIFWVGTAQLYDTVVDCIDGNVKTIKSGIIQYEFEVMQKMRQLTAMKNLLIVD
jgi:hypothetical protein